MAWCMRIFMNCDLLFPAFVNSLLFVKHFQAKVNDNNNILAVAIDTSVDLEIRKLVNTPPVM